MSRVAAWAQGLVLQTYHHCLSLCVLQLTLLPASPFLRLWGIWFSTLSTFAWQSQIGWWARVFYRFGKIWPA